MKVWYIVYPNHHSSNRRLITAMRAPQWRLKLESRYLNKLRRLEDYYIIIATNNNYNRQLTTTTCSYFRWINNDKKRNSSLGFVTRERKKQYGARSQQKN